jgi:serine/threonine protein kinase
MPEFYGVQKRACANDSTMIRLIRICRKCGAKIFSDAPEALCARCVLKSALGGLAGASLAGGGLSAVASAKADDPGRVDEPAGDETDAAAAGHNKKTARAAELLGELGDYELLEEVGRGGQGVVFRARQKSLNRTVALKVISLGQWASKAHLKRFRLEAEAAAHLEHPGIVPIHEVGERDGSCYFSMKFIEGGQLDEVVRRTPMSIRRAVELIANVARTLHYAHEHGILHRDIKPGNILLDAKGEPHLTDFGLARLVQTESTMTRTMEVLGTPSYMAPEQAMGNNAAVTSVTDVYGLGAVLYQLLTGQPPFAGGATYETIKLLLETEPRQPRLLNPKIDRDLSTICLKCLEKDPKRRYLSALALAEDLEHWIRHEPIQARRTGVFIRGHKWVRRNPTTGILIATASLILIAVGMLALFLNARSLEEHTKTGQSFRERAKADLSNETNPIKNVTALRSLALALSSNRKDTEAAKMARNLLLQRVWCPPAEPEVRYPKEALLAATFAPGGNNDEVFAVASNGELLKARWKQRELSPMRSLFDKLKPTEREVVQPAFVSFSPNGEWLFIIPPTLASAANAEDLAQGPSQQRVGGGGFDGSGHEECKLQIWRWSMQKRTYESAGGDLEFQRLRGSQLFNSWSPESDRVVLINTRLNEAECVFFQLNGDTFQQLPDQSNALNSVKIVALAFANYRSGIAAVSVDSAAPALRKVSFISGDDFKVVSGAIHGQDSIRLSEDFQPNGVAFGPGDDQLTLTSWGGVRILDLRGGKVTPVPMPTFRDQFMRMVIGPGDSAKRLVATLLYGRVEVARNTQMQEPAEPVVFGGSTGIAQFSPDGQRLLILSGGIWNLFDRMRLIDVSPLYRTRETAPENFDGKSAPPWLADIAATVSALDTSGDGSLLTLETVRKRYPESKAGDAYEAVWKRFFPDEHIGH